MVATFGENACINLANQLSASTQCITLPLLCIKLVAWCVHRACVQLGVGSHRTWGKNGGWTTNHTPSESHRTAGALPLAAALRANGSLRTLGASSCPAGAVCEMPRRCKADDWLLEPAEMVCEVRGVIRRRRLAPGQHAADRGQHAASTSGPGCVSFAFLRARRGGCWFWGVCALSLL